jgi:hypothetical protein
MIAGDTPSSGTAATAEIPDLLMLAAVDRAARHRPGRASAVPVFAVMEHLGLPPRSSGVRVKLYALERTGALQRERVHGAHAVALTATGRRRLQRARRAGRLPELPESPQHRAWRQARTSSGVEIDPLRRDLRNALQAATLLLDTTGHSDDWLELGERLQRDCRRMGAAIHCLHEWREPDDTHADVDKRIEPTDKGLDRAERQRRITRRIGRRTIAAHRRVDAWNG